MEMIGKIFGTAKMTLIFRDIDVLFRVFIGGVKSNLLWQDFMKNQDYCDNFVVLNYDLLNQRGEYSVVWRAKESFN